MLQPYNPTTKPRFSGGGSGGSRGVVADGGVIGAACPADTFANERYQVNGGKHAAGGSIDSEHVLLLPEGDLLADGDEDEDEDVDGPSPWDPSRWEVFLCSILLGRSGSPPGGLGRQNGKTKAEIQRGVFFSFPRGEFQEGTQCGKLATPKG